MPYYGKVKTSSGVRWICRWSVTDPVTGKRSQPKAPGTFRTKGEAERWYEKHIAGKQRTITDATPLREYLPHWLETHPPPAASSARSYGFAIASVIKTLGHIRIRDLTRDHIDAWHRAMRERGFADSTMRTYHVILVSALNRAVDDGRLYTNPASRKTPPMPEASAPPHWDSQTVRYFLAETEGDWKALPFRIMAQTGIRPGECRHLRWDNVDLERGLLKVRVSKSAAGVRTIAIPESLRRELQEWRSVQKETMLIREDLENNNLIIRSPFKPGKALTAEGLSDRMDRYCARLGLTRVTPHSLRHSYASWMAELGVHPLIVKQALGHRSLDMTLGVYSHASEGMSRQAASLLDDDLASNNGSCARSVQNLGLTREANLPQFDDQ